MSQAHMSCFKPKRKIERIGGLFVFCCFFALSPFIIMLLIPSETSDSPIIVQSHQNLDTSHSGPLYTTNRSLAIAPIGPNNNDKFPITNLNKRVALVIGNSRYSHFDRLTFPQNDAKTIASNLVRLGFDVSLAENLSYDRMQQAIQQLMHKITPQTTVLFYYSGHGLHLHGQAYLVPTDTSLQNPNQLQNQLVNVQNIVRKVEQQQAQLGLFFIDTYPKPPISQTMLKSLKESLDLFGLASNGTMHQSSTYPIGHKSSEGSGTLIAFAHAPTGTYEAIYGPSSPFAKAFLKWLEIPHLELGDFLRRIREDVKNQTNYRQIPWETGAIEGTFYLNKGTASANKSLHRIKEFSGNQVPSIACSSFLEEEVYWISLQRVQSVAAKEQGLKTYLQLYPNGRHKVEAEMMLEQGVTVNPSGPPPTSKIKLPMVPEPPKNYDPKQDVPGSGPAKQKMLQEFIQALDEKTRLRLQEDLKALGYYHGPVPGPFGPQFFGAIYAYQQARSMKATGYFSAPQLAIFFADAETKRREPEDPKAVRPDPAPSWYMAAMEDGKLGYVYGVMTDPDPDSDPDPKPKPPEEDEGGEKNGEGDKTDKEKEAEKKEEKPEGPKPPPVKLNEASAKAILDAASGLFKPAPKIDDPVPEATIFMKPPGTFSWSNWPCPITGRDREKIMYRAALSSRIYAEPALFASVVGKFKEGDMVAMSGKLYKQPWYQVLAPDGQIGYVPESALVPCWPGCQTAVEFRSFEDFEDKKDKCTSRSFLSSPCSSAFMPTIFDTSSDTASCTDQPYVPRRSSVPSGPAPALYSPGRDAH